MKLSLVLSQTHYNTEAFFFPFSSGSDSSTQQLYPRAGDFLLKGSVRSLEPTEVQL